MLRHPSQGQGRRIHREVCATHLSGATPLPGSDRWNALAPAEQQAIYADYAAINQAAGVKPGLPLGLPSAATTVQVRNGKAQIRTGPYQGVGGFLVFEADDLNGAVMDETGWLAQRFDENRSRLRAVTYRMLGAASDADDARLH